MNDTIIHFLRYLVDILRHTRDRHFSVRQRESTCPDPSVGSVHAGNRAGLSSLERRELWDLGGQECDGPGCLVGP